MLLKTFVQPEACSLFDFDGTKTWFNRLSVSDFLSKYLDCFIVFHGLNKVFESFLALLRHV